MSNDKKNEELILDEPKVEAPKVATEAPKTKTPKAEEKPKKSPAKKAKPKYDAINVYSGKMFIRQYSLDIHGPKFADIAQGFAKDRGFGVEGVVTKDQTKCPACGHKFEA